MFANLKQIFKPKNKDLRNRIYYTLFVLFIFKIGTAIIVPGIDENALGTNNLGFLEMLNYMGGGAMERFSVFSLGVMPYITASIIVQLLQMDIFPYFSELSKQGHTGRAKINMITRYMGIFFAFIQGFMFATAYAGSTSMFQNMKFAFILSAGTAFLLWLGDRVTQKGIGNGISMIIMAGIITSIPAMFVEAWTGFVAFGELRGTILGIFKFLSYVTVYIGIILGVVFMESAERRIPIQYANKSNAILGKQNYIPFKLNSAGVMPVILGSAIISAPGLLAGIIKKDAFTLFVNKYLTMTTVSGLIIYLIAVFIFSYIYTFLQLKPKDINENLQNNGGFIPGVRPGKETVEYLIKVVKRINFIGALFLCTIAGLPVVFGYISKLPASVTLGGTGLLIVVGVALETSKQLESKLLTRNYNQGRR